METVKLAVVPVSLLLFEKVNVILMGRLLLILQSFITKKRRGKKITQRSKFHDKKLRPHVDRDVAFTVDFDSD